MSGVVRWDFDTAPELLELRLFWYTQGKGDEDVGLVEAIPFEAPQAAAEHAFSLELPVGPYSFSGKLISIIWALELVADEGKECKRLGIVLGPQAREVVLG